VIFPSPGNYINSTEIPSMNRMFKKVNMLEPILICGPTASGKSKLAMNLANEFGAIIINADALQIYDGWRILTARPNLSDEKEVKHFLYGTQPMNKPYSVGNWLKDLEKILINYKDTPKIIVGGTGLYFTSLIQGLADIPSTAPKIRNDVDNWHKSVGDETLSSWLKVHDPKTFSLIDSNNSARIKRAIETLIQTGKGLSDWQKIDTKVLLNFSKENSFVLNIEADILNKRISDRFKNMMKYGAIDEVKEKVKFWNKNYPAFKAIGAQEIHSYLKEELTLEEATEKAIIRTRQYAKRQRTWFRSKMKNWTQINV